MRKLFIEIAEKNGVTIEKEPLTGKKHLEKNDFIIARQEVEIQVQKIQLEELTFKLDDIDTLAQEVAQEAYERACEVVTDTVMGETIRDDITTVQDFKDKITGVDSKLNDSQKNMSKKILNKVVDMLFKKTKELATNISKKLMSPEVKRKNEFEIAHATRVSIKMKLAEMKEKSDQENATHTMAKKIEREGR